MLILTKMGRFQDQKILFNALSNNVKAAFKIIEIIQEVNVSASNCQIPENSRSWLVSFLTAHDNVQLRVLSLENCGGHKRK